MRGSSGSLVYAGGYGNWRVGAEGTVEKERGMRWSGGLYLLGLLVCRTQTDCRGPWGCQMEEFRCVTVLCFLGSFPKCSRHNQVLHPPSPPSPRHSALALISVCFEIFTYAPDVPLQDMDNILAILENPVLRTASGRE